MEIYNVPAPPILSITCLTIVFDSFVNKYDLLGV